MDNVNEENNNVTENEEIEESKLSDVENEKDDSIVVGMISLGCDKNRVDSEIMLTYLRDNGFVFSGNPEDADVLIVNTCGFIKSARDESFETIKEICYYKQDPNCRCKKVVVTGCLPQKWSKDITDKFPDVDIVLGIDQYPSIAEIIRHSLESDEKLVHTGCADTLPYAKNRIVTTPLHYAYLKIADGCDNFCTFCTIPYIRGRYRSRDESQIIEEANSLVNAGATELILVAQDISRYGFDKTGKSEIVGLIRKLSEIEKLKWIRLLYCYPEMITDELFDEMMKNKKLCNYLDIPLQHISDNVLKKMNRKSDSEFVEKLIEKVKNMPEFIALRTTIMTGFPGENEEDFDKLTDFLKRAKFMHVGFFAYSREDGTAASSLPDQVDEKTKIKRLNALMKLQKKIAKDVNSSFIGKTIEVCLEGFDEESGLFFGRSQYQTPDADSIVLFSSKKSLEQGKYYNVKIKSIAGFDLKGEVVYE